MNGSRPKVAVIGTGGSISAMARHSLDLLDYIDYAHILEVDELLARFPEASAACEVVPVRFRAINSVAMTTSDWLDLNRKIGEVVSADPSISGVVVTHGTATMEETAYFLHLASTVDRPIVLVGAQRPPNGLSTDAGINLVNAIRVAASPAARGLGVLVVLNDEIQSAREVSKSANFRLQAFRTPELGVLGFVDPDGSVTIYRKPTRRHAPETGFDVSRLDTLPRVDIVYAHAGADAVVLDALVRSGSKGIVLAGLPPGRPTFDQRTAMVAARRAGIAVVQSSRAGAGRVIASARDLADGIVAADNLNPQKARVLTMLALTVTNEPARLQQIFNEY
jgi:L-asparaginase